MKKEEKIERAVKMEGNELEIVGDAFEGWRKLRRSFWRFLES